MLKISVTYWFMMKGCGTKAVAKQLKSCRFDSRLTNLACTPESRGKQHISVETQQIFNLVTPCH